MYAQYLQHNYSYITLINLITFVPTINNSHYLGIQLYKRYNKDLPGFSSIGPYTESYSQKICTENNGMVYERLTSS